MPFLIDEKWLPATLTVPPMDDDQFAEFCAEHPDLFFETTAEGELLVMPPNFTLTGMSNAEIARQLANWARNDGRGTASNSSTGFLLPNGARRSPDAAWTSKTRGDRQPIENRKRYWHLCPDFVIELRSDSDRLPTLRAKMLEWLDNGAQLGWLIDPERRAVEIYRPGRDPETLLDPSTVQGEGPVAGFSLSLPAVWDPTA